MLKNLVARTRWIAIRHLRSVSAALLKAFGALAQKRSVCVALIGVLAFAGAAAIGLLVGIPEPAIHDEFSYLLAADTFAHGRLTNPTHPMWVHFESFHVIHQPSYMSKYPPAQGLFLAAGQVFSGYPIAGVWLSFGFMCAAIYWMLYGWLPPNWALLGGFLVILHPELGVRGYWAQSYWGGAAAAGGGALVAGGLRRIVRGSGIQYAVTVAIGLIILANSRPYEGLLFSLPAGVVLLRWMVGRNGPPLRASFVQIIIPITLLLVTAAIGMGFYNFRITGSALRLPYTVHEEMYDQAPLFLWQKPHREPEYRHTVMRDFHRRMLEEFYLPREFVTGFLLEKKTALRRELSFYFENVYLMPLLAMLPLMIQRLSRSRWHLFALLTCSFVFAGYLIETFEGKHYIAPITAFVFLLLLQPMRLWRRRDPLIAGFVIYLIVALSVYGILRSSYDDMQTGGSSDWRQHRARVVKELEQTPGNHLVVVSYGPRHSGHQEWVYNSADIDGSRIVWARDMGKIENDKLLSYFKTRDAWLLRVDYGERPKTIQSYELTPLP